MTAAGWFTAGLIVGFAAGVAAVLAWAVAGARDDRKGDA